VNPRDGSAMVLDLFFPTLRIAFVYRGDYKADDEKERICKEHGVRLKYVDYDNRSIERKVGSFLDSLRGVMEDVVKDAMKVSNIVKDVIGDFLVDNSTQLAQKIPEHYQKFPEHVPSTVMYYKIAKWLHSRVEVTGVKSDHICIDDILAYADVKGFERDHTITVLNNMLIREGVKIGRFPQWYDVMIGVKMRENAYCSEVERPKKHADTSSVSERRFATTLEEASGIVFERNVRPEWLVNPVTSCLMELDLFCDKECLAIEYDGRHHYEFPNMYHKTREEFDAQQARDKAKDHICMMVGVRLIRVLCGKDGVEEEVRKCMKEIKQG
jgi:hypothetical protein